jgi:hypothetical protein
MKGEYLNIYLVNKSIFALLCTKRLEISPISEDVILRNQDCKVGSNSKAPQPPRIRACLFVTASTQPQLKLRVTK